MKFDLEAAKRGEPVECEEAYGWVAVRFIGPWDSESAVCAVDWSYKPEIVLISKLRMAKKKEGLLYRLCILTEYGDSGEHYVYAATDRSSESRYENLGSFVKWLTDWQEYEIGANDE